MTWRTVGLAGQVFDGPFCYVDAWDIGFQRTLHSIAGLGSLTERRRALARIEAVDGIAYRRRVEAALKRLWSERSVR